MSLGGPSSLGLSGDNKLKPNSSRHQNPLLLTQIQGSLVEEPKALQLRFNHSFNSSRLWCECGLHEVQQAVFNKTHSTCHQLRSRDDRQFIPKLNSNNRFPTAAAVQTPPANHTRREFAPSYYLGHVHCVWSVCVPACSCVCV